MEFPGEVAYLPFSVALALMLLIALLEALGLLLGLGFVSMLDTLFPDVDLDIDGADNLSGSASISFLGWLSLGRVPLLVWLIILLTAFGLIGITLQMAAMQTSGHHLPVWLAVFASLLFTLPVLHIVGGAIARLMPSDESEAVSVDSFIGATATVTLGTARSGSPAEAKLKDAYGQVHYVMIEPEHSGDAFSAGTHVRLVAKRQGGFTAEQIRGFITEKE